MSIVRDVPLTLDVEELLCRRGIGRRSTFARPEMRTLLSEMITSTDDLDLLEPAIVYEVYPITEAGQDRLYLGHDRVLNGRLLPSFLSSARELAVVVCTIGPRLEEKVTHYSAQKALLRALLLDVIGSAAVDCLAQKACHFVRDEACSRGYQASSAFNPGIPGLPISEQRRLFQLVPAEQIGVRLTSSAIMVPRKSVSMIVGMGPDMPTWTQVETCERCNLKETCSYRAHVHP